MDVFSICTLNSGLPLNCSNVTSVEKVEILDPRPGQAGAWPPQQPIRGDAGSWKQRPAFRRGTGNENNEPPSRHVNHVWQTDSKRKATLITALSANQAFTLVGPQVFPIYSKSQAASEHLQTSPAMPAWCMSAAEKVSAWDTVNTRTNWKWSHLRLNVTAAAAAGGGGGGQLRQFLPTFGHFTDV